MAARGVAEGRPRRCTRPVRRRARRLAPLPPPARRRGVLRRADGRPPCAAGASGRQDDGVPRPSEGRAPRGRTTCTWRSETTTRSARVSCRCAAGCRSRCSISRSAPWSRSRRRGGEDGGRGPHPISRSTSRCSGAPRPRGASRSTCAASRSTRRKFAPDWPTRPSRSTRACATRSDACAVRTARSRPLDARRSWTARCPAPDAGRGRGVRSRGGPAGGDRRRRARRRPRRPARAAACAARGGAAGAPA